MLFRLGRDCRSVRVRFGAFLLSLGLFWGLYLLLGWSYYGDPVLFGKDCGLLFEYYYGGDRPISSIYLKTQGYFSFVLYFFPWLFAHFPTILQPWLYTWCAAFFMALPVAFLLAGALFHARAARILFALVVGFWHYGANGLDEPGTMYVLANMAFWPVCLLYFLLICQILEGRSHGKSVALLAALSVPALLSHPYSIAALPGLAFLALSRVPRATRASAIALIALSLVYATTHDTSKSGVGSLFQLQTLSDFTQHLVNGVLFFHYARLDFVWAAAVLFLGVIAALCWWRWRPQDFQGWSASDGFLLVSILGLTALYFASYRYAQYGISVPPRYSFIQQTLWLIFLLRRLEALPQFVGKPRLAPLIWVTASLALLTLRGAFGETSFHHLHRHEAAVRRELFDAMGQFESLVERHPNVAFLVFTPNHNWPSRNFFIGHESATRVVDFNHTSRDDLLALLRFLGATDSSVARVRRAHEIYGVERNLVRNGRFEDWRDGVPDAWTVANTGDVSWTKGRYGDPPLPMLVVKFDEPGASATLSHVITLPPDAAGATLRIKAHTRTSDGSPFYLRVSVGEGDSAVVIAEKTSSRYPNWLRGAWDVPLPESLGDGRVSIEFTVRPEASPAMADLTNVLATVRESQ